MSDTIPTQLLALHSCTDRFGVAVQQSLGTPRVAVFDDGRSLSNSLIERVDSLLPRSRWDRIRGIAVATGPGGFTGTRLTVVMARTLAQQLDCPLLGVSSFALMAQRMPCRHQPFWITQVLPRRGVVAGRYSVAGDTVTEIEVPHLLEEGRVVTPALAAELDVEADVVSLMAQLQHSLQRRDRLPWQEVLPIYPTSPVGPV